VYDDVETEEPQFATVKEGFIARHLTVVPLAGVQVVPDDLRVAVTKEQVRSAPDLAFHGEELSQADESTLYHHFELNYTPPDSQSGRRLARRSAALDRLGWVPPTGASGPEGVHRGFPEDRAVAKSYSRCMAAASPTGRWIDSPTSPAGGESP
jgi:hypothetical protein